MKQIKLTKFIDKNVVVLVRYRFKKKVEETQSFEGKLINIDRLGSILERKIGDTEDIIVNDFFYGITLMKSVIDQRIEEI